LFFYDIAGIENDGVEIFQNLSSHMYGRLSGLPLSPGDSRVAPTPVLILHHHTSLIFLL